MTETYAEKLLDRLTKEIKLHTFCGGLSGILYLFEFLRDEDFIDMDVSEVQSEFDNFLIQGILQNIKQQRYDFMHAALGPGLYFLKNKTNREAIEGIVDFLYQ